MDCVTIIISTRNRAASLRETLCSIACCDPEPKLKIEVIVVDNASTDGTRRVVENADLSNVSVRYLYEPRRGVSRAKNRALAAANGDILLFTDDDVHVPRDWISRMCQPITDGEADAVAGGVILPEDRVRLLRSIFTGNWRPGFSTTQGLNADAPEYMIGSNMAFARRVLNDVPMFDESLGPGALGFHEEALFSWRLLDFGYRLVARFDVYVEHHFDVSRLNRSSLLSLGRSIGASDAYVDWHWKHMDHSNLRKALRTARRELFFRQMLRPYRLLSRSVADWEIYRVINVAYLEQLIVESRKPRRYSRHRVEHLSPKLAFKNHLET